MKLTTGVRLERWALDLASVTAAGSVVPVHRRVNDLLPAAAVTVRLNGSQNLRFAASQTISRPEYRELSPVPYFEGVGLLTTFGNPDLRRALIQNYDARWEWYPRGGEVVSIGAFAKRFDRPIEKVIVPQAGASALGFVNATSARNYGVELEFRKGLDMLVPALAPLELFVNATFMRSRIEPGSEVLTNADRPMVGQSPYVFNVGLSYLSTSGRWNATVLYNVSGHRILEAGAGGLPDSYEATRNLLDVSVQAPLLSTLSMKLDARNLLDAPYRLTQGDVLRERYTAGRVFSAGFTWRP
ncbi:MAG: TonB-dependent receptor [Gemmatimonadales bacterium]|nr:TonB-dependent receptor [Gemmatimonadales bacterium]